MSNLKLYVVEQTREIVVLAKNEAHAEELAKEADDDSDPEWHASPMTAFPADYDRDCIPHGACLDEDPDRTIGAWIDIGAAPKLAKPMCTPVSPLATRPRGGA